MVNRQRQSTGELAWTNVRCDRSFNTRLEPPSALKRTLSGVAAGRGNPPGYPIWATANRAGTFQLFNGVDETGQFIEAKLAYGLLVEFKDCIQAIIAR